ncbi:glycosyltransferase family 2 protein [Mesobaculum littorinae]|uniref:Glycosyltransferase family 2 protein n=1 Tax=Mesobaculum littorinae TaxID=2486419 RepID=A0A438AG17_9RHOB|nr:glycosyltransferase family 2 protein [Mesobaculum littorinae]RVV97628.1 glycosyltransferase family 2 protein [Mesobaculum littorinae]
MWRVCEDDLRVLKASPFFDPEWYQARYPDVVLAGMDPAEHYLLYGFRLGRDPGPDFSTRFHQLAFPGLAGDRDPLTQIEAETTRTGSVPAPAPGHVLNAAHQVFLRGARETSLALADRFLAERYRHTLHILEANKAQVENDRATWISHVNGFLNAFGQSDIALHAGHTDLFHDLATAPLPAVTDGPLISIIMPVHNAEETVEKAIQSILDQTWKNLEIIAVDDCSTDSTPHLLRRIMQKDPRLRVHRLPVNAGPYVARNVALGMARGDWITCHDADDWAHPKRLEDHLGVVLPDGAQADQASVTHMIRMRPDGFFDTIVNANPFSPDGVTRISSVSALFQAEFLRNRLGYWDTVRVGADSEMISRAQHVTGKETRKLRKIGMICLSTDRGLTRDPILGVRPSGHLSDIRAAYKASWTAVHDRLPPDRLFLPFPQETRRYRGDFTFDVPYEDVVAASSGQ